MFLGKLRKMFDIREKTPADQCRASEDAVVIEALREARADWMQALREFDNVRDDEIIDYCIYKIKACQTKYEYFLREAKRRGITTAVNEEIYFLAGTPGKNFASDTFLRKTNVYE